MINLKEINSKCFAYEKEKTGVCDVMEINVEKENCNYTCPFYKPIGCDDWIKRERGNEIWLIPPEEYIEYAERIKNKKIGVK